MTKLILVIMGFLTALPAWSYQPKRIYSALITSAGAITSQTGNFISSVGHSGTGVYDLTFTSGVFGAAPACTCMGDNSAAAVFCRQDVGTAVSATAFYYDTINDTGAASNSASYIICKEP